MEKLFTEIDVAAARVYTAHKSIRSTNRLTITKKEQNENKPIITPCSMRRTGKGPACAWVKIAITKVKIGNGVSSPPNCGPRTPALPVININSVVAAVMRSGMSHQGAGRVTLRPAGRPINNNAARSATPTTAAEVHKPNAVNDSALTVKQ